MVNSSQQKVGSNQASDISSETQKDGVGTLIIGIVVIILIGVISLLIVFGFIALGVFIYKRN